MTNKVFLWRVLIYLTAVVWGAIQAWNYRFELYFGDSQQFFDIAHYYRNGQFSEAVSTYWSPLYPMIEGLVFKLIAPSPYWEFLAFKLVNLIFLVTTFLSYEFFFAHFYKYYTDVIVTADPDRAVIDRNTLLFSGYSLLFLFTIGFVGVHQDTPDMVLATLVLLSSGFLLKQLLNPTKLTACLFGLTLGFGYLCKTIMFSMTIVYLGLNFVFKRNIVCILISFACFAVLATPWVWTISERMGQISFGESAKFIYINLVEERDPCKSEGLAHPIHFVENSPTEIRTYGDEVPGTVPFLYDLGYWTKGSKINFRIGDLSQVIFCSFIYYCQTFFYLPLLVVGFAGIASRSWPLSIRSLWKAMPVLAPALAFFAQYSMAHNLYILAYIDRYFVVAYPIAMLGILAAIRIPGKSFTKKPSPDQAKAIEIGQIDTVETSSDSDSDQLLRRSNRVLKTACVFSTIICFSIAFTFRFTHDVSELFVEKRPLWYDTAMALRNDGIKYGDQVAQLGMRLHRNTQFTEAEKLRITVSVAHDGEFWKLTREQKEEVLSILRKFGVRALVYAQIDDPEDSLFAKNLKIINKLFGVQVPTIGGYPNPTDLTGWKQVPGYTIYYYLLNQPLSKESG